MTDQPSGEYLESLSHFIRLIDPVFQRAVGAKEGVLDLIVHPAAVVAAAPDRPTTALGTDLRAALELLWPKLEKQFREIESAWQRCNAVTRARIGALPRGAPRSLDLAGPHIELETIGRHVLELYRFARAVGGTSSKIVKCSEDVLAAPEHIWDVPFNSAKSYPKSAPLAHVAMEDLLNTAHAFISMVSEIEGPYEWEGPRESGEKQLERLTEWRQENPSRDPIQELWPELWSSPLPRVAGPSIDFAKIEPGPFAQRCRDLAAELEHCSIMSPQLSTLVALAGNIRALYGDVRSATGLDGDHEIAGLEYLGTGSEKLRWSRLSSELLMSLKIFGPYPSGERRLELDPNLPRAFGFDRLPGEEEFRWAASHLRGVASELDLAPSRHDVPSTEPDDRQFAPGARKSRRSRARRPSTGNVHRRVQEFLRTRDASEFSATKIADALQVSPTAVKETQAWATLMATREGSRLARSARRATRG